MKGSKSIMLILLMIICSVMFSFLVFAAENSPTGLAVSLPDKIPNIITQTAQKDKAAIVFIQTIVTGTAVYPTYIVVQQGGAPLTTAAGGNIVGSWQHPEETISFYENGQFDGNNVKTGAFRGTYTTQGSILIVNYVYPAATTAQFTYSVSGNILQISHPQIGTYTYTRAGTTAPPAQTQPTDIVAAVENMAIVKVEGTAAKIETEEITSGGTGTGFIISPDGYILTNAHVVFADMDSKDVLFNQLAQNLQAQLYAEVSKHYKITEEDKEKVVKIMFNKLMEYFMKYGQITNVAKSFYVLNGIASPGENLKVKSWPATVKKAGTVIENVGGKETWGRDVAIIKVEKTNLPTVTLGDSSKVQVGDTIFVIGYPSGATGVLGGDFTFETAILEPTVTKGVVSSKKQLLTGLEILQTDAAVNKGNSGGPAYNENGEVIGIATFKAGGAGGAQLIEDINYLLPINLAKEFMNELNVENRHSIIDTKYSEALNAFWRKDCDKTISRMKDVLTLYPGHPYAQEYVLECERARIAGEVSKPLNIAITIAVIVVILAVGVFFYLKKRRLPLTRKK